MNVAFATYYDFTSQSSMHVFHLANTLSAEGDDCVVCVPERKETLGLLSGCGFRAATFAEALEEGLDFDDGRGPDVVHAWTPREHVRAFTEELSRRAECPYVVHLEDNEHRLTADYYRLSVADLLALSRDEQDRLVVDRVSHPYRAHAFLERAGGVSVIIDRLREFVPEGTPSRIVWPGFDPAFLDLPPADARLRGALGIRDGERVVVYPGNVHSSNRDEVMSLYVAVSLVNRRGMRLKLVRLGRDVFPVLTEGMDEIRRHVIEVGYRPSSEVARYVALADALVQPGRSHAFNDYRLPAKLPEFFASGRPVVLPATNVGRHATDGENCLLLRTGTALEITKALERLFGDPALAARIGQAGRDFAIERFDWKRGAKDLRELYAEARRRPRRPVPRPGSGPPVAPVLGDRVLRIAARRYRDYRVRELDYGRVRDFADSLDHLRPLATISRDMKDIQRPWVLKAVIGAVPLGGRLLEIGAGEPFVADLLERLGYDVTVVDPYDGTGNGPVAYEAYVERYPRLRIIRQPFTDRLTNLEPGTLDCVYSISVLEHVPDDGLAGLFAGIHRFLKPGGLSIHAIDHVLEGWAAPPGLTKARLMLDGMGLGSDRLDPLLATARNDTETYFLSAESHNLWRGRIPYESYPMRRCISVHVATSHRA